MKKNRFLLKLASLALLSAMILLVGAFSANAQEMRVVYFPECSMRAFVGGTEIAPMENVPVGTTVTFVATPPIGHGVYYWDVWPEGTLSGDETAMVRTLVVGDVDVYVHVEFDVLPPYTLVFEVVGGQGEIEAKSASGGVPFTSGQAVNVHEDGFQIVFSASPADGYQFAYWTVNGEYVFEPWMVQPIRYQGLTVTITFERAPPVVSFGGSSSGTINAWINGIPANPLQNFAVVAIGDIATFTPNPAPGFRFVRWLVDWEDFGTDEVLNIKVEYSISILAMFERIPDPIAFYVAGGQGTLTARFRSTSEPVISGQTPVQSGVNVIFTATPAAGYRIASWIVNGDLLHSLSTELTRWDARHLTVIFEPIPLDELPTVTFTVIGSLEGHSHISAIVDYWRPLTQGEAVQVGQEVVFSVNPAWRYRVVSWNITGGKLAGNPLALTRSLVVGEDDIVVTVNVEPVPAEMSIIRFNGWGRDDIAAFVDGIPLESGQAVPEGTMVTFIVASLEVRVRYWQGADSTFTGNDTSRVRSVVVDREGTWLDVEVEPIVSDTINFWVAGGEGELTAINPQTGEPIEDESYIWENESFLFIASPAIGYRVASWNLFGYEPEVDGVTIETMAYAGVVTVTFEPIPMDEQIMVTFFVTDGHGGTIEATFYHAWDAPMSTPIESGQAVWMFGEKLRFIAIPEDGYHFLSWIINGWMWYDQEELHWNPFFGGDVVVTALFAEI